VGPAIVALARGGTFAQLERGPLDLETLGGNRASLALIFDLLATQGWVERDRDRVHLTPCGLYAAQIGTSYGVTVSYLPLLNVLSTLLFGNPRIQRFDETGSELLVNRGMNVWGSGGAHKTYFRKVDEIIVEIFNRPLDQQPEGICDMGCGDGTLLEHLYCVVKSQTDRGSVLDEHPLLLVGVDFNKVARRITKQTLRRAGIPSYFVIGGDINRPAQLASDLEALGHDVHNLLHVRSFLDHNRPYSPPANYVNGTRTGTSSGAFAYLGDEVASDELEENCSSSSFILCHRNLLLLIWEGRPRWLTMERTDTRISTWSNCPYFRNAPVKRGSRRTSDTSSNFHPPIWLLSASISLPRQPIELAESVQENCKGGKQVCYSPHFPEGMVSDDYFIVQPRRSICLLQPRTCRKCPPFQLGRIFP
jgi:hypothetical protein